MITAWRITKKKHLRTAFDGESARLNGGRWNSVGTPLVYTAGSRSLAALEMAVHLDRTTLRLAFAMIPCEFEESLVDIVDRRVLPDDWRQSPAPTPLAIIGDQWAIRAATAILAVPSAVIDEELNFLLNPKHPLFPKIRIGEPHDFEFDSRLIK